MVRRALASRTQVVREVTKTTSNRRTGRRRTKPRSSPLVNTCGSKFIRKILRPFGPLDMVRYPDEVMIPTALASQIVSNTYVCSSSSWLTAMTVQWLDSTSGTGQNAWIIPASAAADRPGPVVPAFAMGSSTTGLLYDQNWPSYSTLSSLMGSARPLFAGIQVSISGLPSSTFMASGKIYFCQIPAISWQDYTGGIGPGGLSTFPAIAETAFKALVSAGRGFVVDAEEVRRRGRIFIPWLVANPNDLTMGLPPQRRWQRYNGGNDIDPQSNKFTSDIEAYPEFLCVAGYGMASGTVVNLDYTVGFEYTASASVSGMVETEIPVSSSRDRDTIWQGIRSLASDIFGVTDVRDLPDYVGGDRPTGVPYLEDEPSAGAGGPSLASILGGAAGVAATLAAKRAFRGMLSPGAR